jgi:NAD(P)-dependent dehydrogenase (short-subunit alcohol dehydrogenase family)
MTTVLIIGASRGIGLELVRQYRADNCRVIATARDDAGLQALQAMGAQALRVDVAKPASVSALDWQLDGEKIDTALYVAGVMDRASAKTPPTQETFDHVMHANVMGAMMVVPQVATKVEEANGVFAFFSSQMGSLQNTRSSDAALYRISKAALNMVVRTAQHDYPRARMVAVHPGWVQTDMGGMQATLTPAQSVTQLRQTLASVTDAHKGQFLSYDGTALPW